MYLDMDTQMIKSNQLHSMIKHMFEHDIEFIKKAGVEVCQDCKGTGLKDYGLAGDNFNYTWQPGSYCDSCGSIGYVKLDKLFQMSKDGINFLCRNCYGIGCGNCDNGYVDWIKHAKGY